MCGACSDGAGLLHRQAGRQATQARGVLERLALLVGGFSRLLTQLAKERVEQRGVVITQVPRGLGNRERVEPDEMQAKRSASAAARSIRPRDADAETIDFAKDESTLYFRIGGRMLTSRQLTGQFPNFEAVLPKDNSKSINLHGEELGAAISRVAQFADERSRAVRLRLDKGELKLSASSTEAGESEDSIETDYTGDPLAIGFNAQYILDFLKAVGAGDVKLELKDAQSAGQLRPAESEDYKYRYIVMPMRI